MSEAFRIRVLSTLIGEIASLTGGRFEQFGYRIMEAVYPAQWTRRGTTIEGAPRGFTVDASADGAHYIAETSSENDYFHGALGKLTHDLDHALELHPCVKKIWLVSSRMKEAGETTRVANLITEYCDRQPFLESVEILDSRAIADCIFDNLANERLVGDLASYLPSLERLADEHAFSHQLPSYPDYQPRPEYEALVMAHLNCCSWVVLKGISGAGKSALAARIAQLFSDYDTTIWIDAHELSDLKELSDVDVRRMGTHHNIAGLMRRHRCLVIIDDATMPLNQLTNIEFAASKVIVTCQATSEPDSILVGDLTPAEARNLLNAGVPEACPEDIFQKVFFSVGGHALLLTALNRVARDEGWESVDDCCAGAVSALEDDRHEKVCQRILLRHRGPLLTELEFIKWCETSRLDPLLANACVSSRAVANLQKRAFLAATTSNVIRVHDVVFQSITAVTTVSRQHAEEFADKLADVICLECDADRPTLRRLVNLHLPLIKRLLSAASRPPFVYALALARTGDTPLDLLGDPLAKARELAQCKDWLGQVMDVRAVIEAVEAIYTVTSLKCGTKSAKVALERNIAALEVLVHSPLAQGDILRDLRHHYAKMLARLNRLAQAESEFRLILAEHPQFVASRLQLARLLEKTRRKSEAFEKCAEIIHQHEHVEPVSIAVLLEALRMVATVGTPEQLGQHEAVIMLTLKQAREMDGALAVRLLAAVAQKTWFIMPDLVSRMCDAIEWRDVIPVSDSERSDLAQAYKGAAKVMGSDELRRREFLLSAVDAYNSIQSKAAYYVVQNAEAYILLDEFDEAVALLDSIPDEERNSFWRQRRSQALLGLKLGKEALNEIEKALENLGSEDGKYKPAFLRDRSRAKQLLSDPEAEADLESAISLLPEGDKFRQQLESELDELRSGK